MPQPAAPRAFTCTGEPGKQAAGTFTDAALLHDTVRADPPADAAGTPARTQRPASPACSATAVTGPPARKTPPSRTVTATPDHAIHPHTERDTAKRAGSQTTKTHASYPAPATHARDMTAITVRAVGTVT